jgi:translocation and assembly module TamB
MRRTVRIAVWLLAPLLGLPLLAVLAVFVGLNTDPGRHLAERLASRFTGGEVSIQGVAGRFPDHLRVGRIEVRDAQGVWLTVRDAALDWSPLRLASRVAEIDRLAAVEVDIPRLPTASGPEQPSQASGGGTSLPVGVDLRALHVEKIVLGEPVAGVAAALTAEGSARLDSLQQGLTDVTIGRLDGGGAYHLAGHIDAAALSAALAADEPAGGLLTTLAKVPQLGPVALRASVNGPWTGAAGSLSLRAGPLNLDAKGRVNIAGSAADLDVTASAPVMAPRPDVSWQAVALDAHVHGPFTMPQAHATLRIDGLAAAGAALHQLAATVDGNAGHVALTATLDGLRLPGPQPNLLAAAPVTLKADATLTAPDRPVTFSLEHPLLALHGTVETGGEMKGQAHLDLPDLAPLAQAGGADVQGRASFDLAGGEAGGEVTATLDGAVGITGGMAPLPALLGPDARIGVTAAMHGHDISVSRLSLAGLGVTLDAHGGMTANALDVDWQAALADISAVAATVQGSVRGHGHVAGPLDNLAVQADLTGDLGTAGLPRGPISVSLDAHGLPDAPTGHVTATGTLDQAPLALDVSATRAGDGTLHADIASADWKSAHAEGNVTLPPHATLPQGRVALRMDRLDDLNRLLGQPLSGGISATAQLDDQDGRSVAQVSAEARDAGLPNTATVGRATLAAKVLDPTTDPDVTATLDVVGLRAGTVSGSAKLAANGKQSALALKLQAAAQGLQGADAQATAAAMLDLPARQVTLSALQADWKGLALRLLAPVRVAFGNGVAVDRARLGLGAAVLEVAGRASPTLDLTASLRGVTPELARAFAPDLRADGTLEADAKLTGTLRLAATGLHVRTGPAAALPPAELVANATLAGRTADLDAHVSAGRNRITLTGTAPIDPAAAMRLRALGGVDLALLNPLLTAEGRQVHGQVNLDATIGGTLAAPRADGTLRLANGDVQDLAQGVHLSAVTALVEASGETIRLSSLNARAGSGSLAAHGTIGLGGTMPVDLALTAQKARPLASDRMTATLDANLSLRGDLAGTLAAGGSVTIDRADIGIPDRLPASVPVLQVRRPGQPPPAAASGPDVALDVTVSAPAQVFVRGRGLYAELAGRIHVGGTAVAPIPVGSFRLRRGEFNLAGQMLTFTSGEISFQGDLTDPALNFVASSYNGSITAMLTVGGFASAPKITLSSTPDLPQDEVLAQLLFHQSASTLSALQLAQAAAALAQISGVGGGAFDPLNTVRKDLGLDRLNVGGGQGGTGANVEAGRYVARGVYVGAKQAATGGGTQATVQVDLLRGLKLETNVGMGGTTSATGAAGTSDPYGTSVGLTYQFQY